MVLSRRDLIKTTAGQGSSRAETCQGCEAALGIDEGKWRRVGELADAANDGSFDAIRGFEWSSPTLGHINVWGSQTWTDPLATGAVAVGSTTAFLLHEADNPLPDELEAADNQILRLGPGGQLSMAGFYDWLQSAAHRPVLGSGSDAIAGFNHPGPRPVPSASSPSSPPAATASSASSCSTAARTTSSSR
jgi:hypothetical protein